MVENATDRCSEREVATVGCNIGCVPVTTSPTHVQPVAAALCDEVVDPQSDVVAHRHNKKALMVEPVAVKYIGSRAGVSRISRTKSPGAVPIRSFPTSAPGVWCPA